MSTAAVNALVLSFTVLLTALLAVSVFAVLRPPPLTRQAKKVLRGLAADFKDELRAAAADSVRAIRRQKIGRRDIRAEYERRIRDESAALADTWHRVGEIGYALASFGLAVPPLPFFPPLPHPALWSGAAALLAAFGAALTVLKSVRKPKADDQRQRAWTAVPAGRTGEPVATRWTAMQLWWCGRRVDWAVRTHARHAAASQQGRTAGITEDEIRSAWQSLVIPLGAAAPAPPAPAPRTVLIVPAAAVPVGAVLIYFISAVLIPKLPLGPYAQAGLILTVLILLYLPLVKSLLAMVRALKRRGAVFSKTSHVMVSLIKTIRRMPGKVWDIAEPLFPRPPTGAGRRNAEGSMSDGTSPDGEQAPGAAAPDQPPLRFGRGRAIVLCVLAAALLAASIWMLLTLPVRASLLHLQWAGSAAAANTIVRQGPEPFRAALDRDFVLTVLYAIGLVTAGYLGWKVFWTHRMQAAARVGMIAAITAGLSNVAQDVLLLIALSHQPMSGEWLFRGAEAFSFVKFSTLLVAIGVGLIALTATASRVIAAPRTEGHWRDAAAETEASREPKDFTFAPRIRKLHEQAGLHHSDQELWPEVWWGDDAQHAGDADGRAGAADPHWSIGSTYPFDVDPDEVGICASGGGIRSATVTLGALQSLRSQASAANGDGLSELERARYLVSVSGGGYTTSALQLAMHAATQTPRSEPPEVFAPGSIEEDHLRRHSSYISDPFSQWVVALGVLLRCVITGIALIGLTVTVLGVAIGAFYNDIPITYKYNPKIANQLAKLQPLFLIHTTIKSGRAGQAAPPWPGLPSGVTLAVAGALALTAVAYLAGLTLPSRYGKGARRTSTAVRYLLGLTGLLLAIGVAIPALIWLSAWLTWHPHFSRKTAITTGTLAGTLNYFGAVAATLWHKKAPLSTSSSSKTGVFSKSTGGQVLPSSMVQMLLLWLCLLVLVLAAFLASGWVATSGLPTSPWALLPVGVLLFAALFIDESWLSLHPFYRRRLALAFAIPSPGNGARRGAQRHREEPNPLSTFAARPEHWRFPEVKFAASANITSQDRTPPGRRAVPFMLASGHVGGPQTGWVTTAFFEKLVHKPIRRDLDVTAARAISGAAFAAAMGSQTRFFEVFLAMTNVRLGAWLPNPWFVTLKGQRLGDWTIPGLPSRRRLTLLAREIFGIHPSWARMLLCTDGGHYDNLGLIELLRLQCKLIYCIDASGGGAPLADTLAGTLAVAREELGVDIKLKDPLALVPGRTESSPVSATGPLASLHQRLSETAVIVGDITYPGIGAQKGTLIFAQADLTRDMPYQVLEYSQNDPGFPRDSTADQWFNSGQFDVYQQLGRYLGEQALNRVKAAEAATNQNETSRRRLRFRPQAADRRVGPQYPPLRRK